MKKTFNYIKAILVLTLCFSAIAFGQGYSGSIEGTVTDSAGAVIPGASVTVKNTGATTGFNSTVTTNGEGYYNFPRLAPGTYRVTVKATNFAEKSIDTSVVVDKAASLNLQLSVVGATGTVDITAEDSAVTVDTSDTKIDTNISKQVMDALPKGTNFTSLLKTAPNVRPEARTNGFQIDGASGSENVFVIDGQEVTNFRTGSLNSNNNVPFEVLQEIQVKSTGFEAEYGGATGGVINAVTAGGNDQWRGNFAVSFSPGKLQGSARTILNRFDATNSLATGTEYFKPNKDGGTDFFPVANFTGPIIKGKVWFSATYAPQLFNTSRSIDYVGSQNPATRVYSGTTRYDASTRREYAFGRIDAQPTSTLRMFGTFLWNPIANNGLLPATTEGLTRTSPVSVNFPGIGTFAGPDLLSRQGGRDNSNSVNGQVSWNPTSRLILNFRSGRSFLNEKSTAYFVPRVTRYVCSQVSIVTAAQTGCAQGFQNVTNNSGIDYDVSTRRTFDADANIVGVNFAGRHNFKGGYQYNKLFNTVSNGYKNLGIIQLFYGRTIDALGTPITPSGPICAVGQTTGCVLGSGLMTRFGTVGTASSSNTGLFVQDSWQIMNRLTVNAGVRVEKEEVPNFGSAGTQAIKFGWGDKIAPRFGVAFDLTGDGKTKVFGSYGWFYDRFKYELPRGSFGGDFFRRDYFEILPTRGYAFTSYNLSNILGNFTDPVGGQCPITSPTGFSRCQFDFRIATNISGANIFESGAVDPNIKAARQSEYTFGIERQLATNFIVKGRYTHKNVDRAIEDVGVINSQGSEAYIIGNPGFGTVCEVSIPAGLPCPKAERKYDAVEVTLDKRSSKYFINANYTWSRLFGNYSGLASTDEVRSSPNVNRFFDLPPLGFNADGDPDNGLLSTDRPHVFKAYGGYTFNWGGNNKTTVSGFTTFQSGTPNTTIYNLYSLGTTILNKRGDLGRTEMFTESDLGISHSYKFGRDNRLTLQPYVDIRNLFDEKNVLGIQTNISSTNFNASQLAASGCTTCGDEAAVFQTIFNGPGIRQYVNNYLNAQNALANKTNGTQNDYKLANSFQGARSVRFGFRLFF
jgi:Carboxypeptidase regulatory-like domain/TonB dependent receptor/TonB-dependent Receptor Plug Domain